MENKNMRKLNVTVQCMAVYNSSIMVPRELTFEEAIKYAKEHIDEINLGELEYISDSDELDEENCDFDEEEDTDSDCRVLYETGIEEPEILGSGSTYSNVVCFPDEERAFEEFHHCGRNYLHRITYRKKSPYTTTEWWDEDSYSQSAVGIPVLVDYTPVGFVREVNADMVTCSLFDKFIGKEWLAQHLTTKEPDICSVYIDTK